MCKFCDVWDWGESSAEINCGKYAHIINALGATVSLYQSNSISARSAVVGIRERSGMKPMKKTDCVVGWCKYLECRCGAPDTMCSHWHGTFCELDVDRL